MINLTNCDSVACCHTNWGNRTSLKKPQTNTDSYTTVQKFGVSKVLILILL